MLIWLQLLDKLVHLVFVLLFLLLLSLPLLSAVLTLSLADWTTVMPNCCTVMLNCCTVMPKCCTVFPTIIILSRAAFVSLLQWAVHIKLLHLLAVASTSPTRVRVGLAAAHLRVLCFDLPLRGLLLSLLLLLLRLLALLVCSSLPALSHHILPFHPVRVLVAGALVRI